MNSLERTSAQEVAGIGTARRSWQARAGPPPDAIAPDVSAAAAGFTEDQDRRRLPCRRSARC